MTPNAEAYVAFVHDFLGKNKGQGMPHCDALVLHDPGLCQYCGMREYKPVQKERKRLNLNWTGSTSPDKEQCPAEQRRGLETVERWHGNVLSDDEDDDDMKSYLNKVRKMFGY